jgi:hypothetical protein
MTPRPSSSRSPPAKCQAMNGVWIALSTLETMSSCSRTQSKHLVLKVSIGLASASLHFLGPAAHRAACSSTPHTWLLAHKLKPTTYPDVMSPRVTRPSAACAVMACKHGSSRALVPAPYPPAILCAPTLQHSAPTTACSTLHPQQPAKAYTPLVPQHPYQHQPPEHVLTRQLGPMCPAGTTSPRSRWTPFSSRTSLLCCQPVLCSACCLSL